MLKREPHSASAVEDIAFRMMVDVIYEKGAIVFVGCICVNVAKVEKSGVSTASYSFGEVQCFAVLFEDHVTCSVAAYYIWVCSGVVKEVDDFLGGGFGFGLLRSNGAKGYIHGRI